jgi:tRNA-specific 2-thiouridylase
LLADAGQPALGRGIDPRKDQSYVLFGVARNQLRRMLLPVGDYSKDQIRAMATEQGLRVADKPDSQEICFVPNQDHADFIRRRREPCDTSGQIVTTDGTVVGRHDGLEQFTIGQRKGLGLAFGTPRYVVRLEAASRQVVIGTKEELGRVELTARDSNWLTDPPTELLECAVQIRYRSRPVPATIEMLADGRFRVRFHEPCDGVAPGQAAVCYQGDRVLGGGWIE